MRNFRPQISSMGRIAQTDVAEIVMTARRRRRAAMVARWESAGLRLQHLLQPVESTLELFTAGGEGEAGVALRAKRAAGNQVDVRRFQRDLAERRRVANLLAGKRAAEVSGDVEERVE